MANTLKYAWIPIVSREKGETEFRDSATNKIFILNYFKTEFFKSIPIISRNKLLLEFINHKNNDIITQIQTYDS